MPLEVKVLKLEKTWRLLSFCTTKAKSVTMNSCDPETNDQEEAFKPSSYEEHKIFDFINYWRATGLCYVQLIHSSSFEF